MDKKEKNSSIYTITDPLLEPYYIQYDQYCYTAINKIVAGIRHLRSDSVAEYLFCVCILLLVYTHEQVLDVDDDTEKTVEFGDRDALWFNSTLSFGAFKQKFF